MLSLGTRKESVDCHTWRGCPVCPECPEQTTQGVLETSPAAQLTGGWLPPSPRAPPSTVALTCILGK